MNTDHQDLKYRNLTEKIISIFYRVYNKLGYGFLEKIYENAMMLEFKKEGITAVSQSPIKVLYEDEIIGEYYADVLVDNKVIVEVDTHGLTPVALSFLRFFISSLCIHPRAHARGLLLFLIKASRRLVDENEAQLLNYLKATEIEVGLLLNFGAKPEVKRKIFDNSIK